MQPSGLREHFDLLIQMSEQEQAEVLSALLRSDPVMHKQLFRMLSKDGESEPLLGELCKGAQELLDGSIRYRLPLGVPERIGPYEIIRCISAGSIDRKSVV